MNRLSRCCVVVLVACGSRPPNAELGPSTATCSAELTPLDERLEEDSSPHRVANESLVCEVADNNLARAQTAIGALRPPASGPARVAWDHKSKPAHLDHIEQRFGLSAEERSRLYRDGFVVPARLEQASYGSAYHEIYQSQLPIFVTVDSILNAVYATHDRLVGDLEHAELAPLVTAIVKSLHCALPTAAARFPRETVLDLDVYLTVARRLLEGGAVASALGDASVDRLAENLTAKAQAAASLDVVEVFGRAREIDFTQFTPRGHYTKELAPYFRGAMWLSRTEWNLVSRSSRSSHPSDGAPDPRETPREVLDAFALADLVLGTGQADRLAAFERTYRLLAGRREDVAVPELLALAKQAGVLDLKAAGAAPRLIAAIGDKFQRTVSIHPMPQGSAVLPAIATLLGPRIVPDTPAMRPLAEVPDRNMIRGADLAYVLGLDRGLAHLTRDLAASPELRGGLDAARKVLAGAPRTDDLYTSWLDAIRALAAPPRGQVPSFMETVAYSDLRVDSAIAAFAQLRHNHVLIAGQAYGEGGCEIPDGFVEPAVEVYEALGRYADRGAAALAPPFTHKRPHDYFVRLGKLARVLATISRYELANQPLPTEAQQFLAMVTEMLPSGSDGRPTFTGWYFDLFDRREDAIAQPDLIADFFTSPVGGVSYVGVGMPRMGIFVVDTGGGPRAMVGPVAHAYEHAGPLARRLDDAAARDLPASARPSPWTASYEAPAPPEPSFSAKLDWDSRGNQFLALTAKRTLGAMTIEPLGHHREPLKKYTANIVAGNNRVFLPSLADDNAPRDADHRQHLIHFQLGNFHGWGELGSCETGCVTWGWGELKSEAGYHGRE